jgi:hypothetical protein
MTVEWHDDVLCVDAGEVRSDPEGDATRTAFVAGVAERRGLGWVPLWLDMHGTESGSLCDALAWVSRLRSLTAIPRG